MGWKPASVDANKAAKAAAEGGVPFWKPEAGTGTKYKRNWIRILPPRDDRKPEEDQEAPSFFVIKGVHYGVGPGGRHVYCPEIESKRTVVCPICTHARKLRNQGEEDEAQQLSAKIQAFMNIIPLDAEGQPTTETPHVWGIGRNMLRDLYSEIEDLPEKQQDISHPEKGRDVCVKRAGTTRKNTRYKFTLAQEKSAITDESFLEEMHDLENLYLRLDPAALSQALLAGPEGDPFADAKALPVGKDEEEDEGETPRRKPKKEKPVEAEYKEVDEEEEEAPEEKPIRTGADAKARLERLARLKPEPEEEDDEEDEE